MVGTGVLPGAGPRGAWATKTLVASRGLARAGDRLVTAGAGPRLTAATRAVVAPGPAFCRPPPRRLPRAEAAKAAVKEMHRQVGRCVHVMCAPLTMKISECMLLRLPKVLRNTPYVVTRDELIASIC